MIDYSKILPKKIVDIPKSGIRKYFDMGDIAGLMADRNLVIVCGKTDRIFPLA